MTAAAVEQGAPAVTDAEADDDRIWFAINPKRRYRAHCVGNGWRLVRRRSRGVMLRTYAQTLPPGLPDTDKALREAWYAAAWPSLARKEREELVRLDGVADA